MSVTCLRPQRKYRFGLSSCVIIHLATFFLCAIVSTAQAQSCYIKGAFGMDFGTVTGAGGAATSNLTYTCAPDYSSARLTLYYQICIYIYPGDWSAAQPTRRMTNYTGAFLNYDLFFDPARTQRIGPPGTVPVYQLQTSVSPGSPTSVHAPIYGWVYPGQAVPSNSPFQEQGLLGRLRYRYGTASFPQSSDCTTGGSGGGEVSFNSSGVLARYDESCVIVATDLDFGSVGPPQTPVRSTADIRVQCAPGTVWKVALNHGMNFDGVFRRMAGPGGFVKYQLYQDESRSVEWGDTEASMASGTIEAGGATALLTVYGEVPRQPEVARGQYSDTVIATLYF